MTEFSHCYIGNVVDSVITDSHTLPECIYRKWCSVLVVSRFLDVFTLVQKAVIAKNVSFAGSLCTWNQLGFVRGSFIVFKLLRYLRLTSLQTSQDTERRDFVMISIALWYFSVISDLCSLVGLRSFGQHGLYSWFFVHSRRFKASIMVFSHWTLDCIVLRHLRTFWLIRSTVSGFEWSQTVQRSLFDEVGLFSWMVSTHAHKVTVNSIISAGNISYVTFIPPSCLYSFWEIQWTSVSIWKTVLVVLKIVWSHLGLL